MSNITEAWEKTRLAYQQRYASYAKKYQQNDNNKELLGHLLECSYVLITVFGLTSKQVEELEKNNFSGLTDEDFKN